MKQELEQKNPIILFNKLEIENNILKFQIGFLKSENKRIKKKIKKIKQTYTEHDMIAYAAFVLKCDYKDMLSPKEWLEKFKNK